jgi:methylmalonyl-CoA/ethylmalonyl-CoA epimerase
LSNIKWMFHATAFGASYDDLFEPLATLFGCRVLHLEDSDEPGVQRRGGMTWIGDNSIELGEPRGQDSPAGKFLERFGGGMHSLAVQVADLGQALDRAALFGVEVATFLTPEIAFTRPAATAGLLIEWASQRQADDPRWGALTPSFVRQPVVEVTHLAFVGAIVADPVTDALRLGRLLDTEVTVLRDTRSVGTPNATVALGDCVLALYPVPSPADSEGLWGAVYDRPRCLSLGLAVEDLEASLAALADVGVGVRRRVRAGQAILEGTPFPIVLTDGLLPGDPRSVGLAFPGDGGA